MTDPSFTANPAGLRLALDALLDTPDGAGSQALPDRLPEIGLGEEAVIERLKPIVLGGARRLGTPDAFAHMDPPTPWIAWATTQWNAALNQNLLHPDVAPVARGIESRVVDWLAPGFGMNGGHMTPGSTVANLTALWAARELRGVRTVITSEAAHLSVAKAAHILGLAFHAIPADGAGRLNRERLPDDLGRSALVLTAGTTSAGAIDDLSLSGRAAWTHIDAAWAGPLRFSTRHAARLDGIANADSVAVSAHKWLFQPKEAGLILFRDTESAHRAVSFGGAYLTAPNIGLLGSHGAAAVPLLATLLAWGRAGLAKRIDRAMGLAEYLRRRLDTHPGTAVFGPNVSGVVLWRPASGTSARDILARLPAGSTSITRIDGVDWLRNVAANPCADIDLLWAGIERALA